MAIVAPMAEWKPFTGKTSRPLAHDIVCVHTMVGKLLGSWNYANGAGNPYWHFGLGADGRLLQCHPLEYRSAANLEGNDRVIPIETEDGYPDGRTSNAGQVWAPWTGSDVPAWTEGQIEALVEVIVWLCKRFQIPPVLVPDTKPGRRGLAYHRQGIEPWLVPGGEKWSNATGKVCPGDRRIAQFTKIVVPRVAATVAGIPQPEAPLQLDADDQQFIKTQIQRLGDKLMLGTGNPLFPPATYGEATTLPRIMTAVLASAGADVDEAAVAAEVLKVLTPEAIAAAIPDDIAEQVADELAQRLTD